MLGIWIGVTGAVIIMGALFLLRHTLATFPKNFWIVNTMELMERLAFFGVRAILPLYMVASASQFGLALSYTDKSIIYAVWAGFQCFLPIFSGGFTDNFGYKKSLYTAFTLNIGGYIVMAFATGFWSMMAAAVMVGIGTAIFKPPVQGTVAKSVSKENANIGFGMFYWVVNVGGAIAPFAAAMLRGNESQPTWQYVFFGAAIVTAINFLPAIFFYKEPPATGTGKSSWQVFKETSLNLWYDKQILWFLLISSGFWFMFMQLWDLLPNFIDEWVDSRNIAPIAVSILGKDALTVLGNVKPELLINIDSITIIVFVIIISKIFGRFRMIVSLLIGMAIATAGFLGAGLFQNGAMVAFMIFVFAIGEIICSPKFSEYIGVTAPADKKALYMGYSNMPFGFGWMIGNFVSGLLYDSFSSRGVLARDYFLNKLHGNPADIAGIEPAGMFDYLVKTMNLPTHDVTKILWDMYHPWQVWVYLSVVGAVSIIGLIILNRKNSLHSNMHGDGK